MGSNQAVARRLKRRLQSKERELGKSILKQGGPSGAWTVTAAQLRRHLPDQFIAPEELYRDLHRPVTQVVDELSRVADEQHALALRIHEARTRLHGLDSVLRSMIGEDSRPRMR
jgi:hypothetical protein